MDEIAEVGLTTLMGGLAVERFNDALAEVLKNIIDPNTPAKAKRGIKLEVTFKPGRDRDLGDVELAVSAKLAPAEKSVTRMFIALTKAGPVATEYNPNQPQLPNVTATGTNVTPFRAAGGAA
jgi:hypothetical protein